MNGERATPLKALMTRVRCAALRASTAAAAARHALKSAIRTERRGVRPGDWWMRALVSVRSAAARAAAAEAAASPAFRSAMRLEGRALNTMQAGILRFLRSEELGGGRVVVLAALWLFY